MNRSVNSACRLRDDAADLIVRIQGRRGAIEASILARAHSLADPMASVDPDYAAGLRSAVSAAVEYGILALDRSSSRREPIPAALLSQARHAARRGVSLDTVLRRYFAGYTLLGDFILGEAECGEYLDAPELQQALRRMATRFDELVAAVTEQYRLEESERFRSIERRRAESARRLICGELIDLDDLGYGLTGWHLGIVASGSGAESAVRKLARNLDQRLLLVRPDPEIIWAWLGDRRQLCSEDVRTLIERQEPRGCKLAFGEPAEGLVGWRLTHRQAAATLLVIRRTDQAVANHAEVCLLASMLQDEILTESLRQAYLAPLAADRDNGVRRRRTLRAYFAAQRNVSSAASALGVDRKTVASRLRAIEDCLGRSLDSCAAEVEAALRLEQVLEQSAPDVRLTLN